MKVVQINCHFRTGSTGKIVEAIHNYVNNQGDESFVIYGLGKKISDNHLIRTTPWIIRKAQSFRSRITGYPYGGCIWGTATAINALKRIQPDVVHIQCANGYMVNIYRVLDYLRKNKIPTVITNHAEFMYTGGCVHAVDCKKWISGCNNCDKINKEHPISYFFDRTDKEWHLLQKSYSGFYNLTICCVSDWVRDRASISPFFKDHKVITVLNGLNTSIFDFVDCSNIKDKYRFDDRKTVVHVTPNFMNVLKGGQHVIEMANRFPEVEFIVIGSELKPDFIPENCHFIGRISDQSVLAQFYSMADVCLLTSVRETFSMVCAESLCCGTPIVGFKSGGPELISLPEYSNFVEQGNDDELELALKEMLNRKVSKKAISDSAKKVYSQDLMCQRYYQLYKEIV